MPPDTVDPIITAMTAQDHLRSALVVAGFLPAEFPQMCADVDPFGLPLVRIGAVGTDTADRLAEVIVSGQRGAP